MVFISPMAFNVEHSVRLPILQFDCQIMIASTKSLKKYSLRCIRAQVIEVDGWIR